APGQVRVAAELPQLAGRRAGPDLGVHSRVSTGIAPSRGVIRAALHLEFLESDRIRDGNPATEMPAALQVIDLNPIHLEIVIAGMRSADDQIVIRTTPTNFAGIEYFRGNSR